MPPKKMAAKKTAVPKKATVKESVTSTKYPAKRKNIPPAGLEAHGRVAEHRKFATNTIRICRRCCARPRTATEADKLPELLAIARQRALSADEAKLLADALRRHEPWLEWSGKREKPWFEVEPVALHMHERISTQAILRVLAREDVERDLFADPQQEYAKAVQFYQHDVDWANRMILGDSLQVMASLARREDLAGKVQMIYLDPPYGIRFRLELPAAARPARREGPRAGPHPRAGDGQSLPRHLDARHPLLPRLPARPSRDGPRTPRRLRQHLRADQR